MVGDNIHFIDFWYNHYTMGMKRVSSGLSPVIAVDRKAGKPLHKQIYDGFRSMIVSSNLRAGQQIPFTRALALELKISRIPVLTAYAQLLAEGYDRHGNAAVVGVGWKVAHERLIDLQSRYREALQRAET